MKNKVIVLLTAIFITLITFIAGSETLIGSRSVDQHEIYANKNQCGKKESEFCTHLPLISIDTNNQKIPGIERDGSFITTDLKIINNKENGNHLNDKAELKSKANIHYRGNSSMYYDKHGYLVKLVKDDSSERKEKLLGMEQHDEWVLHGPFLDKTLLRNYLWYHISKKIMGYAPDSRFCELFVDGKYQGVYVLVESPSRGEKSRIPISKYNPRNSYTSYIVRLDRVVGYQDKVLNNYTRYTYNMGKSLGLEVIYPGKDKLTPSLQEYIRRDINQFEKSLYSYDYDSKRFGYSTYIDVDSFVDYYIINEFTQNYDAGNLSTYLYKDPKGKYGLYPWDFNSANDYYGHDISIEEFDFQWNTWYFMLMKDEDFTKRIIDRYHYLRKHYLSDEYLMDYIDSIVSYLGDAVDRNYEVWGYTFNEEEDKLRPKERNVRSYDEAIKQLKNHIKERGKFLDENIETIQQFSSESKVKKFNH